MQKTKELFEKHKDKISYLFFGACTTAVNLFTFWALGKAGVGTTAANAVSICAAVIFAYFTNAAFVFHGGINLQTLSKFIAARAASAAVEMASVWALDLIMPTMWAKLVTQMVVVVLNYVFSKFLVFREKD